MQALTTSRLKRGDLIPGLVLKTLSLAFCKHPQTSERSPCLLLVPSQIRNAAGYHPAKRCTSCEQTGHDVVPQSYAMPQRVLVMLIHCKGA